MNRDTSQHIHRSTNTDVISDECISEVFSILNGIMVTSTQRLTDSDLVHYGKSHFEFQSTKINDEPRPYCFSKFD